VITRRRFLALSTATSAAWPRIAEAQQEVRRVAFFGPPQSAGGLVQAFQQGLRELGYVEGQNIKIDYRYTDLAFEGRRELFSAIAAELVGLRPEVLVVSVTEAAIAARNATRTIPIVMVNVPDPVAAGLVRSLSRPGGNVTGLSRQGRDVVAKSMQLLKETLPQAARFGVLGSTTNPLNTAMVADAAEAAIALGVQLKIAEIGTPAEIEGALATMQVERVSAVLMLGGSVFYLQRTQIAALALKKRLPAMSQNREFVEAGGLLSYAPSTIANYRRAAFFVDRILRGVNPADLPVEQPTQFELAVNLKTARALGVKLPAAILLRADQVIE
jgi:putative tryptophan/tyrosine transport system substrate-binding protein